MPAKSGTQASPVPWRDTGGCGSNRQGKAKVAFGFKYNITSLFGSACSVEDRGLSADGTRPRPPGQWLKPPGLGRAATPPPLRHPPADGGNRVKGDGWPQKPGKRPKKSAETSGKERGTKPGTAGPRRKGPRLIGGR